MVELRDKDRLAEAITENIVNILKVENKDVIMVIQEAPIEIGTLQEYVSKIVIIVKWMMLRLTISHKQ